MKKPRDAHFATPRGSKLMLDTDEKQNRNENLGVFAVAARDAHFATPRAN
jgi:hypothetical protein